MEMRLRTPVTRGYFFFVNAASPPTISIDKEKISSGTQGTVKGDAAANVLEWFSIFIITAV